MLPLLFKSRCTYALHLTVRAACVAAFFVFACATLGVLMVMETLSAFLHALRLHWVRLCNMSSWSAGCGYVLYVYLTFKS